MKLNEFKHLIRNIVNESLEEAELSELARIANLIQPGDEAALADVKAKFKGTWVEKMVDHVIANPNGSTKIELAQAAGKPRQQDVNPVVNKLLASGAFVMGGLVTPKKEKPATTGVRGRPVQDIASLSDEQKVGRLVKQIKNYLRGVELSSGNPSPAPRQMDIDWFDSFSDGQYEGLYNVVEAYVNSPSVATEDAVASFLTGLGFQVRKRGRPMGSAAPSPGEDMPLEEKLMMQKRAGIISEEEYRQKKSLIEMQDELELAYARSPKMIPWNTIETSYQESGLTGEEFFAGYENEFRQQFEGTPVSKEAYFDFYANKATGGQDDRYIMAGWISFTDPDLGQRLYNQI